MCIHLKVVEMGLKVYLKVRMPLRCFTHNVLGGRRGSYKYCGRQRQRGPGVVLVHPAVAWVGEAPPRSLSVKCPPSGHIVATVRWWPAKKFITLDKFSLSCKK